MSPRGLRARRQALRIRSFLIHFNIFFLALYPHGYFGICCYRLDITLVMLKGRKLFFQFNFYWLVSELSDEIYTIISSYARLDYRLYNRDIDGG